MNLLVEKLKPGGTLHITTDWEDYAEQALQVLMGNPSLINTARSGHYTVRPSWRPVTKFERRGLALGHRIRELAFRRRLSSDRS